MSEAAKERAAIGSLADELGRAWLELGRRMWSRKLSASLHPKLATLSPGRLQALMLLGEQGGPRIGDLADSLGLDESTVTRLVDRLELAGLAERRPTEADRRATVVVLTAAGREAVGTMLEQRKHLFAEILDALEPSERAEFVRLTTKVAEVFRTRAAEVVGH